MDDDTHPDRLLNEPLEQNDGAVGGEEVNSNGNGNGGEAPVDPNAKAVEEVVNSEVWDVKLDGGLD